MAFSSLSGPDSFPSSPLILASGRSRACRKKSPAHHWRRADSPRPAAKINRSPSRCVASSSVSLPGNRPCFPYALQICNVRLKRRFFLPARVSKATIRTSGTQLLHYTQLQAAVPKWLPPRFRSSGIKRKEQTGGSARCRGCIQIRISVSRSVGAFCH